MDCDSCSGGSDWEFQRDPKTDGNEEGLLTLQFAQKFCGTVSGSKTIPNTKRIRFFFKNTYLRKKLESWTQQGKANDHKSWKNESVAAKNRAKGISLFVKADDSDKGPRLKKCLEHFNLALLHSSFTPDINQAETSKLFANRSAVFYDLKRYDDALKDIETALKLGYPFLHKVWIRKVKILTEQRKFKDALSAVEFIEGSVTIPHRALCTWNIETEKRLILERLDNEDADPVAFNGIDLNRRRFNRRPFQENPTFRYASGSVRIAYNDELTRHVVAAENVEPGDILFDEIPYASVLLPDAYANFCYHCNSYLNGYIFPCKSCSEVKYCGETCCLESWEEYHSMECQKTFLLQSVGLCHLAARIVMRAGVNLVLKTVATGHHSHGLDTIPYFQSMSKSSEDEKMVEYLRIYSLAEHSEKMAPIDMFTYAKTAAGVTHWLQTETTFFNGRTDEEIWTVGGAILRHTCQLISNAQRLYAFRQDPEGLILDYDREVIGSAIYASTSLMNHSCDPNISTSYKFGEREGRRLIVKATRKILTGQEVLNSYGVTYQRHDFRSRTSSMAQQYFFTCKCSHCQQEASGYNFVEGFESLLCDNPSCLQPVYYSPEDTTQSFSCRHCALPVDMKKKKSWLEKTSEMLSKGHELYVLYTLQKQVIGGHRLIAEVHDSLAKSFIDRGEPHEALPYLSKSLDYAIARFGTSSNEYGFELRKYAELLEMLIMRDDPITGRNSLELMESALSCLEMYFPSTD